MEQRIRKYIALVVMALSLWNCAGSKELVSSETKETKYKKMPLAALMDSIHTHGFSYEHLKIKSNAHYADAEGNKNQFRIILRAQKDSIIHLGISKAGIQAVKAVITADSVLLLNNIDKNYMLGTFEEVKKILPLEIQLNDVENLIVGNILPSLDTNHLITYVEDGKYVLANVSSKLWKKVYEKGKDKSPLIFQYQIDPKSYKITALVIYLPERALHITVDYTDFTIDEESGQSYPASFNLVVDEDVKNTTLQMKVNKLEWGKPQNFPFHIPEKYTLIQKNEKP